MHTNTIGTTLRTFAAARCPYDYYYYYYYYNYYYNYYRSL